MILKKGGHPAATESNIYHQAMSQPKFLSEQPHTNNSCSFVHKETEGLEHV